MHQLSIDERFLNECFLSVIITYKLCERPGVEKENPIIQIPID